jgi:hypothetical protein
MREREREIAIVATPAEILDTSSCYILAGFCIVQMIVGLVTMVYAQCCTFGIINVYIFLKMILWVQKVL